MASLSQGCLVHGPLQAAGRQHASAVFRRPTPAAPQRRRLPKAVAPAAHSYSSAASASSLQPPNNTGRLSHEAMESVSSLVAQKEEELKTLFAPNAVQPKAKVVAALRKEIAMLRGQLQAELGISYPGASSQTATPLAAQLPTAAASLRDSTLVSGAGSGSSRNVLDALRMVEAQLSLSRNQVQAVSLTDMSQDEQQELLRLQDENTSLKSQLDGVLARQAQLQVLWDHTSSATATAAPASPPYASSNPTIRDFAPATPSAYDYAAPAPAALDFAYTPDSVMAGSTSTAYPVPASRSPNGEDSAAQRAASPAYRRASVASDGSRREYRQ